MPIAKRNIPEQLLLQKETKNSGEVSFGEVIKSYGEGRYRLKMIIPEDMLPADTIQEHTFNLGPNQPGIRFIFRLVSGRPRIEGRPIKRFTIHYVDLPDSEPYSAEKLGTVGIIEINREHPDYKAADEAGERELADTLAMFYIASAITEYGLKNHPAEVQLAQAAVLAARTLRTHRGTRTKRS